MVDADPCSNKNGAIRGSERGEMIDVISGSEKTLTTNQR